MRRMKRGHSIRFSFVLPAENLSSNSSKLRKFSSVKQPKLYLLGCKVQRGLGIAPVSCPPGAHRMHICYFPVHRACFLVLMTMTVWQAGPAQNCAMEFFGRSRIWTSDCSSVLCSTSRNLAAHLGLLSSSEIRNNVI